MITTIVITHFGEFHCRILVDETSNRVTYEGLGAPWVSDYVRGRIRRNSENPERDEVQIALSLLTTMRGYTRAMRGETLERESEK